MIQKAAYGSMMLERYLLLGFFCGLFVLLGFFVLFLSSTLETAASKFKKEIWKKSYSFSGVLRIWVASSVLVIKLPCKRVNLLKSHERSLF